MNSSNYKDRNTFENSSAKLSIKVGSLRSGCSFDMLIIESSYTETMIDIYQQLYNIDWLTSPMVFSLPSFVK
jgi:hypothetical protein